ncbi:RTX toxin, partial [Pseudomonas sp. PDM14]
ITTTADNTPTFSGTSSNTSGNLTLTVNGSDYTVTPNADGTWSFTLPTNAALADGDYTATIKGSDAQGNEADDS